MIGTLFYVLLVACVVAALLRHPAPILCASIFLMPMTQAMPSPIGVVSVPINLMLVGLAFVPPRSRARIGEPRRLPLRTPIMILVLMMLLGLVIRMIGEARGQLYVTSFLQAVHSTWYLVLAWVVYALVFRQLSRAPQSLIRRMVVICQVSCAAEGVVAIVDQLRGAERATGYLQEVNSAGAYYSSTVAFFLAYTLFAGMRGRVAYIAAMLLGLAGVVNSISRGAMVSTAVSCALVLAVFFTATRKRTGTKVLVVVAALVIAVNASLLIPQRTIDRVLLTFGGTVPQGEDETKIDDSSHQRLLFWKAGWQLFTEWPLGYGTDTFPQLNEGITGYRKAAHNVYVSTLVEFGAQGCLALLALVIAVFVYLRNTYVQAETDEKRSLALGLMGWWAAHATAHFFISAFFDVLIYGQFWMLLACLACMESKPSAVGSVETQVA